MPTILLCVNARLLTASTTRRRVEAVRRLFLGSGCRVEMVQTLPLEAGPSLNTRLLAAISPNAVIVCGGDGTVFDALQSVAGSNIALGVIPFGTGNILAQNLQMRGSAVEIATSLMSAKSHRVQLGEVSLSGPLSSRFHFLCAAGVGPHASVMSVASQMAKRLAGKGAYWAAGLQLLVNHPPEPFEAVITTSEGVTSTLRVCEAIALRVGALNLWRPGGTLQSSMLRLAIVPETTRVGFAMAISRALTVRTLAEITSDAERERLLRNNGEIVKSEKLRVTSVIYQDVARVVCRHLSGYEYKNALCVQADGEVLESCATTIQMSDKNVDLLFPISKLS